MKQSAITHASAFRAEDRLNLDIMQPVYSVRLVYSVGGALRFASHLDITRELERWLRRARLDIRFTEGFNPHPKLKYGPAKPVGLTAGADIVDVGLISLDPLSEPELSGDFPGAGDVEMRESTMTVAYPGQIDTDGDDAQDAGGTKDEVLPEWWPGNPYPARVRDDSLFRARDMLLARAHPLIHVVSARVLEEGESSVSKVVESALFRIELSHENLRDAEASQAWLESDEWIVQKKPGSTPVDVRPLASNLDVRRKGKIVRVFINGAAGVSAMLPVMKIVNHLVQNFGSLPVFAERALILDAKGEPVR